MGKSSAAKVVQLKKPGTALVPYEPKRGEKTQRIRELLGEGKTPKEISELLDVTSSMVYTVRSKMNGGSKKNTEKVMLEMIVWQGPNVMARVFTDTEQAQEALARALVAVTSPLRP